jgi:hypothetical protein
MKLEQPVHLSTIKCILIKYLACEGVEATEIFQRLTAQFREQMQSRTHVFSWFK